MENDINKILATKRDWRKAERRKADRRVKDGTPEQRKDTADALRSGRSQERHLRFCTCQFCELTPQTKPWWFRMLRKIGFLVLFLAIQTQSFAYTDEQAVKAIIGEAENQGEQGMIYVACAIVNRGTLKGVYGLNAPRVEHHKYSEVVLNEAQTAWALVHKEDGWQECAAVKGASNWENTTAFGLPGWAKQMKVVLVYRDHKFFKKG